MWERVEANEQQPIARLFEMNLAGFGQSEYRSGAQCRSPCCFISGNPLNRPTTACAPRED